jgi:FkbM family methyltransferase
MLTLKYRQTLESKSLNFTKQYVFPYFQIIESLKNIIADKDRTISSILSSRSWRITSPLRQIYDFLLSLRSNYSSSKYLGMVTKIWSFVQRHLSSQQAQPLIEETNLFIDKREVKWDDYVILIKYFYLNHQTPQEEDFYVFSNFTDSKEVFLDIGANYGYSAVSFRLFNREAKIISFEPNPWLKPALQWLKSKEGERFDYYMYGVGDKAVTLELYIPCLNNIPNLYLASFVADRFGPAAEDIQYIRQLMQAKSHEVYNICKVPVEIKPIDDFGLNPTIVKIDAETFEYQVLQGMRNTLARCRPLIMLEGANRDEKIRSFFSDISYSYAQRSGSRLTLFEGISSLDNGYFIPNERLDEYRQRVILI